MIYLEHCGEIPITAIILQKQMRWKFLIAFTQNNLQLDMLYMIYDNLQMDIFFVNELQL